MIYLGSPYTSTCSTIQDSRHAEVLRVTKILMQQDFIVFSPIVYSVPINANNPALATWNHWAHFDLDMINRCKEFWLLTLPGWEESRGCGEEIAFCRSLAKPMSLLDPTTLERKPYA